MVLFLRARFHSELDIPRCIDRVRSRFGEIQLSRETITIVLKNLILATIRNLLLTRALII